MAANRCFGEANRNNHAKIGTKHPWNPVLPANGRTGAAECRIFIIVQTGAMPHAGPRLCHYDCPIGISKAENCGKLLSAAAKSVVPAESLSVHSSILSILDYTNRPWNDAMLMMATARMKLRHAGLAALATCLCLAATVNSQAEEQGLMRVFLNHARVLKLDRPVSKVIVGNAEVADATVADSRTIVLTGKAFGTTNLVLLDVDGNALLDERILVSIDEGNTVRMFKQTVRTVLSCTPNCEEHQALTGSKN